MEPFVVQRSKDGAFAAGLGAGEAGSADACAQAIDARIDAWIDAIFRSGKIAFEVIEHIVRVFREEQIERRASFDEEFASETEGRRQLKNKTESCTMSYLAKKIACFR